MFCICDLNYYIQIVMSDDQSIDIQIVMSDDQSIDIQIVMSDDQSIKTSWTIARTLCNAMFHAI
jgi:hypothetical protein